VCLVWVYMYVGCVGLGGGGGCWRGGLCRCGFVCMWVGGVDVYVCRSVLTILHGRIYSFIHSFIHSSFPFLHFSFPHLSLYVCVCVGASPSCASRTRRRRQRRRRPYTSSRWGRRGTSKEAWFVGVGRSWSVLVVYWCVGWVGWRDTWVGYWVGVWGVWAGSIKIKGVMRSIHHDTHNPPIPSHTPTNTTTHDNNNTPHPQDPHRGVKARLRLQQDPRSLHGPAHGLGQVQHHVPAVRAIALLFVCLFGWVFVCLGV
jgi:hypothetical protein